MNQTKPTIGTTTTEKLEAVNLVRLFKKGLLTHPFPATYWETLQVDDGKVTWLYMRAGTHSTHKEYLTTVDKHRWKTMSDEARADLLNFMKKKVYNL